MVKVKGLRFGVQGLWFKVYGWFMIGSWLGGFGLSV